MRTISETNKDGCEPFIYVVRLYLFPIGSYDGYLRYNEDEQTVDTTGYRPGFYISDEIMDWCYENLGSGSNGTLRNRIFYQGRGDDKNINWWIGWSYSHEYRTHYISGYFINETDAVAFKLRWE